MDLQRVVMNFRRVHHDAKKSHDDALTIVMNLPKILISFFWRFVSVMSDDGFLPRPDKDVVVWVNRFVNVATANSSMVAIPASTLGTLTAVNTTFNNSILLVETKKAELKAAVKQKNDNRKIVAAQSRTLNRFVQGRAEVTDNMKLQLGLKVRPARPEPVTPETPERFQATGDSSGLNFLSWKHGKNKSGTQYEIWYREGEAGEWRLLFTSSKLRYTHQGVTPGVQIAYKVRAKRSDRFSQFSATSIVYLSGTAPVLTLSKAA
jgi:hypothetical protein